MPRGQYVRTPQAGTDTPPDAESVMEAALSPRAAETRRERRRRDDGDIDRMARMKLAIPRTIQEQATRDGKVLRWFLDNPGRIAEAHDDDWDVVDGVTPVSAGQDEDTKLVLCSKYKDWHQADITRDDREITEREASITAGNSQENRRAGDGLIVPEGQTNRISRERGL